MIVRLTVLVSSEGHIGPSVPQENIEQYCKTVWQNTFNNQPNPTMAALVEKCELVER